MTAFGWITLGHRLLVASFLRRRSQRKPRAFSSTPQLESLESLQLLSAMAPLAASAVKPAAQIAAPMSMAGTASLSATTSVTGQTSQLQTATVPSTLTNFSLPFTPPISLFNPTLGTLVDVKVTASANLTSSIISQNLSTSSGAAITGFTNGSFTIAGVTTTPIKGALAGTTETVTVTPLPANTTPNFTGPSTVNNGAGFTPLVLNGPTNPTTVYTDAADLAFFTASAGRTTITPTLTENATSGASAPNGNLITLVRTVGSGTVTVTYDYTPACPPITNIVRYGIHHQPTTILLTFGGPVSDVAAVQNPANYTITQPNAKGSFTGKGTSTVAIVSAVYNATNHTVLLTTAKQLNVHYLDQLTVNLPCYNGVPTVITFGSKYSLGGYTNHQGQFVPVQNGLAVTPTGLKPLPTGKSSR